MNGRSDLLLHELKAGLTALYGPRLRNLYLYGSYARGDYDAESDFDVLIVLNDFASYAAEVDRTAELGATLSLRYSVSISQVFVRECDWQSGQSPFLRNVRHEGRAA
jgi:predicted nucleotidyltransferase